MPPSPKARNVASRTKRGRNFQAGADALGGKHPHLETVASQRLQHSHTDIGGGDDGNYPRPRLAASIAVSICAGWTGENRTPLPRYFIGSDSVFGTRFSTRADNVPSAKASSMSKRTLCSYGVKASVVGATAVLSRVRSWR
jgi:hypothetical protein